MRTSKLTGYWRIAEMDQWDADYFDMVVPAHITFKANDSGQFQFGVVRGWLDCRHNEREGQPAVEFSWAGNDEGDEKCGRGSAVLTKDGVLRGHLYIHQGDDSGFVAVKGER